MDYKDARYGGSENIIQEEFQIRQGMTPKPEIVAKGFTRGLLAAPYHMDTLLAPERDVIGTSLVVYNPKNPKAINKKGYVMVSAIGSTASGSKNIVEGLYTYPCDGVTGTLTALYNESPSPVAGLHRNLKIDPIGQPILIHNPKAKKIKVVSAKIVEAKTNKLIPIELLDFDSDPHKGTEYELPLNKAFLLPITDDLASCPKNTKWTNCGLNAYTNYNVFLEILVDVKRTAKEDFTFQTGATNY